MHGVRGKDAACTKVEMPAQVPKDDFGRAVGVDASDVPTLRAHRLDLGLLWLRTMGSWLYPTS